jgi:hypothetical protein
MMSSVRPELTISHDGHFSQELTGESVLRFSFSQLMVLAKILAMEVFPVPRGPVKR